jgi:hypothetical protein
MRGKRERERETKRERRENRREEDAGSPYIFLFFF